MSTLMEELTAIKAVEDKITANKVANFAYTDTAYQDPATYADGVANYDPDAEQNIPVGNPSTLKVNPTILTKGWRAQASAITRMLMNHFLGRVSYNLNKVNDLFSLLLTKIMTYMGQPNGIATLDSYGRSPDAVGSDKVYITRGFLGAVFGRLLGRAWTQVTGDTSGYTFKCITYVNGLWVAGSDSHGLWWSEDRNNWTQVTGDTSGYTFKCITYANGLWVAGSNSYGLWWSEDGKSWTQITGDTASYTFIAITYANELWVAGSAGYGTWWSEDGKSWTQGDWGTRYTFNSVTYANGLWVAGSTDHKIWWSEDGKHWTQGTGVSNDYIMRDILYANSLWVCCSDHGMYWSEDGKSWTQGTHNDFISVAYANGLWIAGSNSYGLWWSEDGKSWTQITGDTASYIFNSVSYVNELWIAGSSHGLWWSKDGKIWTQGTNGEQYVFNSVTYANGLWICGSNSHGLWYSSIEDLIADGTIDLGADVPLVNS